MLREEAADKLKHYYDDYGQWVYTTSPAKARQRAAEYQKEGLEEDPSKAERRLALLTKSVHFEAIAQCLEILGDQVPSPPPEQDVEPKTGIYTDPSLPPSAQVLSMEHFRKTRQVKSLPAPEGDDPVDFTFIPEGAQAKEPLEDLEGEEIPDLEVFNMLDLTTRCAKPRFKIGDPAWVADWEDDNPVGFLPVIVTGMEWYPDDIIYFIGFYDETDGTVETNFETVMDDEIFAEIPDANTPRRQRPQLTLVKND